MKRDGLLFFLFICIGFQQFPIIRLGGSFRLYEIIAVFLLMLFIKSKSAKFKRIDILLLMLFGFSPIISLISNWIQNGYPYSFYHEYPYIVGDFRFNFFIFPFLQIFLCFLNFVVIRYFVSVHEYWDYKRYIKAFVIVGTIIAPYSLFSFFTDTNIIRVLPSSFQHVSEYHFRTSGFSQEPGCYVLYQSWVVLFSIYIRDCFSPKKGYWIIAINILALILTLSSLLIVWCVLIIISPFIFKMSLKSKVRVAIIVGMVFTIIYLFTYSSEYYPIIENYFVNKINNFFSTPDHTLDSGSFRNYTGRIGHRIFGDNPVWGVGVGNSIYYMHLYANYMGIVTYGEEIGPGVFPQNLLSCTLAEQGAVGFLLLIIFVVYIVNIAFKCRNYNRLSKLIFLGTLFNIASMASLAPIYSMFLWIPLSYGLGYNLQLLKNRQLITW